MQSKAAHATGCKRYRAFCGKYLITPFPTTQLYLCYFAGYLSRQVQYPTIRLYIAAVRSEQLGRGMEDPLKKSQQLNFIMKGRVFTSKPRPAQGSQNNPTLLQMLIHTVLSMRYMERRDIYLYATAICLAYFGCLRADEISYPSIYTLLSPQATSNYEGY